MDLKKRLKRVRYAITRLYSIVRRRRETASEVAMLRSPGEFNGDGAAVPIFRREPGV